MADPILRSYQLLLETGIYPSGKVVLGAFSTYSRYCGPREAVFTAICRKNAGCSHFIVGRDHTGVAEIFIRTTRTANCSTVSVISELRRSFLNHFGFNPETNQYNVLSEPNTLAISGTQLRTALLDGEPLPDWYVRDGVQKMLREQLDKDRPVFCESELEAAIAN